MIRDIDYTARREELKERYRIPDAWRDLGFEETPSKSCRCPWREDRKPSFSVHDDGRAFKDFSTDEGGDVISFVMAALSFTFKDAVKWCEQRAGMTNEPFDQRRAYMATARPTKPPEPKRELILPKL